SPGTPTGSRFRFPRKGNRYPGKVPADILFIATDQADPIFTRDGVDILYTALIPKSKLKTLKKIQIPTLDGMYEKVEMPSHPSTVHNFLNLGLPYPDAS